MNQRILTCVALSATLVACGSSKSSRSASTLAATTSGTAAASTSTTPATQQPAALRLSPATGLRGVDTPVSIRGQALTRVRDAGLVPDSGGTPTALVNWAASDDQNAQAIVPASLAAGDYRLELTVSGGVVRTPVTFQVVAPQPPSVSAIAPTQGPNDRPQAVIVTGADFVSGTQVLIGSVAAVSVTVVSSTELQVEIPAGIPAGAHGVEVSHAGGSSGANGPQWTALNLADPDQPGAFLVGYADDQVRGASGDRPDVRYYYPALQAGANGAPDPSAGPYPVVIFNHGFKPPLISFGINYRNNTFIAEWLASFGYVVACVDLATNNNLLGSGQDNSQRDADDTLAALTYLEDANLDPNHPLLGLIDSTRAGLAGHSRGGDGALMAGAAELQARGASARVRALVALGPPANDSQRGNTPLVFGNFAAVPLLLVGSSRDAVAPPADQQAILSQAGSPSMSIEIEGGNHSQYKDNDTRIWGDGTATLAIADQHAIVRRYVTAWFGTHLKGQQQLFADYVMNGAQVTADTRLRAVDTR